VDGYNSTARYLHWLIAGLIILQFVLAEWAESAEDAGRTLKQLSLLANHKSVGMTILMLGALRAIWRLTHAAPPMPRSMAVWQQWTAKATHGAFYVLLFALPISGWLMSSASAYSVSWFSLFTFPDLVGADADLKGVLEEVHEVFAQLLFVLALVHVSAALVHHFYTRDDVLEGMLSRGGVLAGLLVVAGGIWLLGFTSNPLPASPQETARSPIAATLDPAQVKVSTLPVWSIDPGTSSIVFTAEQAGAEFTGRFARWEGVIQFDPERLDESAARVTVHLASVDTRDAERDNTLAEAEWFGEGQAVFQASRFRQIADLEFETTDATLSLLDAVHPVQLRFSVAGQGPTLRLRGRARLDRLALGIGTGEWTDTTWVGQFVDVDVEVQTRP
jgi:cytochrome b561